MNRPRYSKAALRTTLQSCTVLVVVCALVVGLMSTRRTAAKHRDELAEHHVQNARVRLERAKEHRELIEKYQDRYNQLVREGLTVRFDRAVAGDWFEAAIPTTGFGAIDSYVIGKNAPYAGPEIDSLTAFRVVSHRLDFTATVADEDEFADLMSSIGKRVPGVTAQEACSLIRNRQSSGGAELLAAHCGLIWYEFTPSNAGLTANASGT
jgi:hypothetical protein